MNDAIAKASTFTRVTFTPRPDADRSLARTASIAEPNELRRRNATPHATRTSVRRQSSPKLTRGNSLPRPGPMSRPNNLGESTVAPRASTIWVLRNHTASIA